MITASGVIDVCNNEQRLYDGVFAQIIEHESEVCHERGQLLANVRVLYQEMLNAIPFYMRKVRLLYCHYAGRNVAFRPRTTSMG